MSPNRRIVLNIIATYGRSLYTLALGLFTARWVLQALGQVDYGLMGVVGGLASFISFFNGLMATAVGRFYAISIGKEQNLFEDGLLECRQWFSTAVFIHTTVPLILMAIGYPIGVSAVRNFLTIPVDRVADCVWVFRFVCISCFLGMVSVPINAMYTAKQYIAELTIYSFITTTLNACILYYMVTHPGVWLAKYAFWTCMLGIFPQLVIAIRGVVLFRECRLRWRDCVSRKRVKGLLYFVGWWAFGNFGGLLRNQGMQVLVNKYFGPKQNAAMTIANSVNGHTMTLSLSMIGAFQPAIVTAYGAGDLERTRTLSYRVCKFSVLFILIFMLPLSLELREVLHVWLGMPPPCSFGLCLVMFAITIIDQISVGHMIAVNARGKIAKYQSWLGGSLLLTLPIAWALCACGLNIYFAALAMLATTTFCSLGRVLFARELVGMSARYWLRAIVFPIAVLVLVCSAAGLTPRLFLPEGIIRVGVTIITCELVYLPATWLLALDLREREFIRERIAAVWRRFAG